MLLMQFPLCNCMAVHRGWKRQNWVLFTQRGSPHTWPTGTPHTTTDLHAMLPMLKDSYLAVAQSSVPSGTVILTKQTTQKMPVIIGIASFKILAPYCLLQHSRFVRGDFVTFFTKTIQKNHLAELWKQHWKSFHMERERMRLLRRNHWHLSQQLSLFQNVMVH